MEADINFQRVLNMRHTYLLRSYAMLDPRVQPLGLVIKLWAKNAGIIDQRDHKLSGILHGMFLTSIVYILHSYLFIFGTFPTGPSMLSNELSGKWFIFVIIRTIGQLLGSRYAFDQLFLFYEVDVFCQVHPTQIG